MAAELHSAAAAVHETIFEAALHDHVDQPRALDLAAGGLGNGARAHEQHARGTVATAAVDAGDDLAHEVAERLRRRLFLAHLRHHVQPLRARAVAVETDGRAVADALDVIHDLLDVGGRDVFTAEVHHVLEA